MWHTLLFPVHLYVTEDQIYLSFYKQDYASAGQRLCETTWYTTTISSFVNNFKNTKLMGLYIQ